MTGRNLLLLAAALALVSSCRQITAPGPLSAVASNRLRSVSDSRDSLRFELQLTREIRAQDWEALLILSDGSPISYSTAYPLGSSRYAWLIYRRHVDGYQNLTGGRAVQVDRGVNVTLSLAWSDIGGRRPLGYDFQLQDDYGHPVERWSGNSDPDARVMAVR